MKGLLVLREERELERKRRDKRVALLLFGEYSESFVFGGEKRDSQGEEAMFKVIFFSLCFSNS